MTVVNQFYDRQAALKAYLFSQNEISFAQDLEDVFRKNFALAAASYFESEITDLLCTYAATKSNQNVPITEFIKNKAIKRQFHSFFDWDDGKNANQFFGFFGPEFKAVVAAEVKSDSALASSIKSFLQIGQLRNRIVHQNYANFSAETSSEDLLKLFQEALLFLEFLRTKFA